MKIEIKAIMLPETLPTTKIEIVTAIPHVILIAKEFPSNLSSLVLNTFWATAPLIKRTRIKVPNNSAKNSLPS